MVICVFLYGLSPRDAYEPIVWRRNAWRVGINKGLYKIARDDCVHCIGVHFVAYTVSLMVKSGRLMCFLLERSSDLCLYRRATYHSFATRVSQLKIWHF